jgi:C-terminal processing protease CtpA/Prc
LKTFADNVTIIGKKTAGEGVGQVVYIDRNRGFAIYLVNHYWNVLNENIDGKGINPDIFVDENDPDYTKAIDNFLKN